MKLSFVVLHFGPPSLTLTCLDSLQQTSRRNELEIVLVDNGSDANESEQLQQGIIDRGIVVEHHVRLNVNSGFSVGMNSGISRASGDLVVALNSDTVVGSGLPSLLLCQSAATQVGFYAVPVYSAEFHAKNVRCTGHLQAEVTALTWYVSCLPVRLAEIADQYVLGPPGPAVVMTRSLVRWMTNAYGFVYDPDFFIYGEDVDLFLRAHRHGFRTEVVRADFNRNEVFWHVGSGASSGTVRTLDKEPALVGRVLSGCIRNVWVHASTLELLPLLFLHCCFRAVFCIAYLRRRSWRDFKEVALAGIRVAVKRSRRKREYSFFLCRLIAITYRRPAFWACRREQGQSSIRTKPESRDEGVLQ